MDPFRLQKQLKDNSNDLDDFYKELKSWGEEMRLRDNRDKGLQQKKAKIEEKKAPTVKKVTFKCPEEKKTKSKLSSTDYSAWDKFDADAECEKVDYNENEDSDLTDECDDRQEEAYLEKEKGNKFVKNQKWDEAIKCYSKAIDFYSYDPIFYANRALCFLKKNNMLKAESDCTLALKLDATYVKAYQRRAAASEALNKLKDAESDLLKVLELEPHNKESRKALDALRKKIPEEEEEIQRPVSKFTAHRNQKRANNIPVTATNSAQGDHGKNFDTSLPVSVSHWPSGDEGILPVKAIDKPVHRRSKKPLKRMEITEVCLELPKVEPVKKTPAAFPSAGASVSTLRTDDLKVIERSEETKICTKDSKNDQNLKNKTSNEVPVIEYYIPRNSVQFYTQWSNLKLAERYHFLKLLDVKDLPTIFKESLDSYTFSEILVVLCEYFIRNGDQVIGFLRAFTQIRRFSTFIMFMTTDDKKNLWKLFDYMKEHSPTEEVDVLIKLYEM